MVHRHQGAKGQMRHKDHPKLVYPSEYSPDNFWNFGCSYKIPNANKFLKNTGVTVKEKERQIIAK